MQFTFHLANIPYNWPFILFLYIYIFGWDAGRCKLFSETKWYTYFLISLHAGNKNSNPLFKSAYQSNFGQQITCSLKMKTKKIRHILMVINVCVYERSRKIMSSKTRHSCWPWKMGVVNVIFTWIQMWSTFKTIPIFLYHTFTIIDFLWTSNSRSVMFYF